MALWMWRTITRIPESRRARDAKIDRLLEEVQTRDRAGQKTPDIVVGPTMLHRLSIDTPPRTDGAMMRVREYVSNALRSTSTVRSLNKSRLYDDEESLGGSETRPLVGNWK